MKRKNRYYRRSKISAPKFRHLLRCFALDLTASETSALMGLSVRSTNAIFLALRRRIAQHCEAQRPPITGVVEVDESYFGPRRVRGLRGRGAGGKTIVFTWYPQTRRGGLHRGVPGCTRATLRQAILGKIGIHTVIHSDGLSAYAGLVDLGYAQRTIGSSTDVARFTNARSHINGIESFWSLLRQASLGEFNGLHRHLPPASEKTEFRFNHRHKNLYPVLLQMLRNQPL
ncbi:MAG: IS1595 family transposase [Gammaproteobacteria bacterium]